MNRNFDHHCHDFYIYCCYHGAFCIFPIPSFVKYRILCSRQQFLSTSDIYSFNFNRLLYWLVRSVALDSQFCQNDMCAHKREYLDLINRFDLSVSFAMKQ